MVPFVLFVVAGALFMAFAGVLLALFSPLLPLAFVALAHLGHHATLSGCQRNPRLMIRWSRAS